VTDRGLAESSRIGGKPRQLLSVDAFELLRSDDTFVADTSAWWRVLTLPENLGQLLQDATQSARTAC
jgi:hypothetical protein